MEHLLEMDCDVCFIQETFLRDGDKAKLAEIKEYGWNILSDPRKHRSGGGIAMLYKNNIELKSNTKVTKYKSFQVMESLLTTSTDIVRLVNIYRPPYTKKARFTECDFLREFEDYLETLATKPGVPVLAGDFNFHIERPDDHYPKKFLELLEQYNLQQHVPVVPTHEQGGTLDLVITSELFGKKIGSFDICQARTKSDHFLVLFDVTLVVNPPGKEEKFTNYRRFKSIDIDKFKEDLLISGLRDFDESMSVDEAVTLYESVLTELMDNHCPVIKKKIKKKPTPWLDLELRTLRQKRRAAERAWRKGKGDRMDYIKLRDEFSRLEFVKRCAHHKDSLRASSGDTKTLYKKLNRLLGNESHDLPQHLDSTKLAEDFKDFFSNKVNKIRRDITAEHSDPAPEDEPLIEAVEQKTLSDEFSSFSAINSEDLMDLVSKMSNKFCCLDPIPTFLLKECVDELTPILLFIVNKSLTTGSFPTGMKKAVVKPTLKKENADADCLSNYRPVSNLTAISKLLERVVLNQLNEHLSSNDLHCPVQSGYRPHHSCETLLVRMTDDINKEIQCGNIVLVVLLDLSAAFDTIDHEILLEKLLTDYNISGKALGWMKSYLEDRYFCVKIDDTISSLLELLFGVPQGSLLGPILFILYIKALQEIAAKYGLNVQFYADDSQLYISFSPMHPSDLADVKDRINKCLEEVKIWMVNNFMKLNEDKTELLVIGKPRVLKEFNLDIDISLQFGKETITPTECKGDSWKSLGVKLDASLSMSRQINNVRQKCSWTMMNMRTIGYYLDEGVKLMMVKQLVISKLDYCNSLYMNLPKTRLNKLRSILNQAIRFIYNISDRAVDLVPYYKKAHILPLDQRIFFKVCLLAHKTVHGSSPKYMRELVEIDVPLSSTNTRAKVQGDCYRLKIPKLPKNNIDNRRFSNYAPVAWNSLPLTIRCLPNTDSFKGLLKNHLYNLF
jgi:hypothetical protein